MLVCAGRDFAATVHPQQAQPLHNVSGSAPAPAAQPAREGQSNRRNELKTGKNGDNVMGAPLAEG